MTVAASLDTLSPLLVQAVEDLLAGAAFTAPLRGNFVGSGEYLAAPQDVTATCALGALHVGHALRRGLTPWYRGGCGPEVAALLDAYGLRWESSLIGDNDRWGRDVVVARCKELVNTAPPADLTDAAGA